MVGLRWWPTHIEGERHQQILVREREPVWQSYLQLCREYCVLVLKLGAFLLLGWCMGDGGKPDRWDYNFPSHFWPHTVQGGSFVKITSAGRNISTVSDFCDLFFSIADLFSWCRVCERFDLNVQSYYMSCTTISGRSFKFSVYHKTDWLKYKIFYLHLSTICQKSLMWMAASVM